MQQASNAARTPEELFEHILRHTLENYFPRFKEEERHLSALGLVCRYWTRLCRPVLFSSISLRTPDDAKCFRQMLHTPTLPGLQPIAAMTRDLTIVGTQNTDEPWFHLVFLLIPKLKSIRLGYFQPCPTGGKWPWCTLHPFLPHSIPGSLMPISLLSFEGAHLHSRSTIVRVVATIPLLEHLLMRDTTYDIAEDLATFPLWDFRQRRLQAHIDDLQLCLSLIPSSIANTSRFIPTTLNRLPLRSIIHKEDLKTLRELLAVFAGVPRFEITIGTDAGGEASKS